MTKNFSKSSKFFIKKQENDPRIKQEPSGILSWKEFLKKINIKQPHRAPRKRIKPNENGPNNPPIAPNNIKSPPPMPSFLRMNLKIKFINHNDIQPSRKPYNENRNGDNPKNIAISVTKIFKKIFPKNPKRINSKLLDKGR